MVNQMKQGFVSGPHKTKILIFGTCGLPFTRYTVSFHCDFYLYIVHISKKCSMLFALATKCIFDVTSMKRASLVNTRLLNINICRLLQK